MQNEESARLQKIYLSDALDQVLANPTAAHAWHHLSAYFQCCDTALQAQIVQLLHEHIENQGVAAFLRATFCAALLHDVKYFTVAANLLLHLQPLHFDRVIAFLGVAWASILANCDGKQEFVTQMQALDCPELMSLLAKRLTEASHARLSARPIPVVKKVALIGSHLGVPSHAPTRLFLQHAAVMMGEEIELRAFSCQEMQIPNMSELFGNGAFFNLSEGEAEQWAKLLPKPLNLHLSNPKLGVLRRYADMVEPLSEFDPDLIFFIGMYSPLVEYLYGQRPVVALAVHAIAPIVSCDTWLCADMAQASAGTWGDEIALGEPSHYSHRIALPAYAAMNRLEIGLDPDALILVCVGYRLPQEIVGEWALRMCQFLAQHRGAMLLLVGGDAGMPEALQSVDGAQLQLLPHQENVSGILDCCDIYVNPVRMGGGFSVLEAMASCMPVVALAGSDGGNKLGEYAAQDLENYFAQLEELSHDASLRHEVGHALRTKFYEEYDLGHAGPRLIEIFEHARKNFIKRQP